MLGSIQPVSCEEFVTTDIDVPGFMPEGCFLAFRDTDVIGMASLPRDLARPDTLRVGCTGTHPEFRRHGIGTELKRRSAVFAQDRGFRFLVTGNDSLNRAS
jgi:GNAT superfamily N-acetyltransferase